MKQDKVKAKLSGISATMLGCLLGRANLSKEYSSLFYDAKAIELVEKIDFNILTTNTLEYILCNIFCKLGLSEFSLFTLRAKQFDEKVKAYITIHPSASIVNIGAGLDTTFYRVDNGLIHWYDLDCPAVIDIRQQLLPKPDRVTYIAKSLLNPSWCKDIENRENGVFIIVGGVLQFFDESQLKQFFSMLADNFPNGEIVFDAFLNLDSNAGSWIDMFPPEQRNKLKVAFEEAFDDWWEKAPQDQREKLYDKIGSLKIPEKPKGTELADLKAWWYQLSNKEREEALRALFCGGHSSWAPKDANAFAKLDNRIIVMDQFPLFKNIPRNSLSADLRRLMDYSDEWGGSRIIHLRV